MKQTIRITFPRTVSMAEARSTLRLAEMAVESMHGEDRVRVEAPVRINQADRSFVFDVTRQVGRILAIVFAGYMRREFGPATMHVEHLVQVPDHLLEGSVS